MLASVNELLHLDGHDLPDDQRDYVAGVIAGLRNLEGAQRLRELQEGKRVDEALRETRRKRRRP